MIEIRGTSAALLAAKITDLGPEALRPAWIRQSWSGSFGSDGLRAAVDPAPVQAILTLTKHRMSGHAEAVGTVFAKEGSKRAVGEFHFEVLLDPSARLHAHQQLLKLDPAAQGTGFAQGYAQHMTAAYEAAGIDDVTLHASLERGSFVWALQDFEVLATQATEAERALHRAQVIRSQVERALDNGRLTPAEHARLAPNLLGADDVITPDTLTSIKQLALVPELGAKALNNPTVPSGAFAQFKYRNQTFAGWDGIRMVNAPAPWFERLTLQGGRDTSQAPHLVPHREVAPVTAELSRRITGTLPEAYDIGASLSRIESSALADGVRLTADHQRSATYVHLPDSVGSGRLGQRLVFDVIDDSGRTLGELSTEVKVNERGSVSRAHARARTQTGELLSRWDARAPKRSVDKALASLNWGLPG